MTTMLDKCAVAGDITQGIDRRGVWTAAITVIGGTSGTAVKLVSSDTVNGEYTDYKTLISAADAETDQYKGFVVDLHGAKKIIKVTGAVMATAVFGDCDHDVKAIAITEGEVPSGADLENNKEVEITENGTIEITPSEGKDGMKKVTATVNVSGGGGGSDNVIHFYKWRVTEEAVEEEPSVYDDYISLEKASEGMAGWYKNDEGNLTGINTPDTYTFVNENKFTYTDDSTSYTYERIEGEVGADWVYDSALFAYQGGNVANNYLGFAVPPDELSSDQYTYISVGNRATDFYAALNTSSYSKVDNTSFTVNGLTYTRYIETDTFIGGHFVE